MANLFSILKDISYEKSLLSDDILVTTIASEPFEVKILFYKKGTVVPPHTHTTNTQHVVLSGKLKIELTNESEPRVIGPLADYKCGGFEYRMKALTDSYVMLIQKPGTQYLKSET